jgi:hypothetical protein
VNPSLNLILKRLDKIDQRLESFEQNTTAEFKAVRGEMAQGLNAVRGEMAQGFDSLRQEFKTDLQKEFEKYGAKTYPIYERLENKGNAMEAKFDTRFNQLLTAMDTSAKNYERFDHDSAIIDAEHQDLKRDVEILKKRDMEKAAAIEKIEKEIDKLKAA